MDAELKEGEYLSQVQAIQWLNCKAEVCLNISLSQCYLSMKLSYVAVWINKCAPTGAWECDFPPFLEIMTDRPNIINRPIGIGIGKLHCHKRRERLIIVKRINARETYQFALNLSMHLSAYPSVAQFTLFQEMNICIHFRPSVWHSVLFLLSISRSISPYCKFFLKLLHIYYLFTKLKIYANIKKRQKILQPHIS